MKRTRHTVTKNYVREISTLFIFVGLLAGIAAYSLAPRPSNALTSTPITGYAWSDTIGWVDLNCSNSGVCGTNNFGFSVDGSGNISGYAWSDNTGWVSANSSDLTGCPSGTCAPNIGTGGAVTGWLKVLPADGNGWDGWISMSGTGYGVTLGVTSSGYAWGSNNVGWLSFATASTTYTPCIPQNICSAGNVVNSCTGALVQTCTTGQTCSGGACIYLSPSFSGTSGSGGTFTGHLQLKPSLVHSGDSTQAHWNVANVTSCSVSGTNGDSWSGIASQSNGATSSAITSQTVYTLACTGPGGSVNESQTVNITPYYREK